MSKPLVFPEAKSFDDIFESFEEYDPSPGVMSPIVASFPCEPVMGKAEPPLVVSSHCSVDGGKSYRCLRVQPKSEVLGWIADNMLRIGDQLSFKVVKRDDGTALIVVTHSCIIGSRWLALVDASTVP